MNHANKRILYMKVYVIFRDGLQIKTVSWMDVIRI